MFKKRSTMTILVGIFSIVALASLSYSINQRNISSAYNLDSYGLTPYQQAWLIHCWINKGFPFDSCLRQVRQWGNQLTYGCWANGVFQPYWVLVNGQCTDPFIGMGSGSPSPSPSAGSSRR